MIYDFEGDTENGELVIEEGTIIKILNQVHSYICMHGIVIIQLLLVSMLRLKLL